MQIQLFQHVLNESKLGEHTASEKHSAIADVRNVYGIKPPCEHVTLRRMLLHVLTLALQL